MLRAPWAPARGLSTGHRRGQRQSDPAAQSPLGRSFSERRWHRDHDPIGEGRGTGGDRCARSCGCHLQRHALRHLRRHVRRGIRRWRGTHDRL